MLQGMGSAVSTAERGPSREHAPRSCAGCHQLDPDHADVEFMSLVVNTGVRPLGREGSVLRWGGASFAPIVSRVRWDSPLVKESPVCQKMRRREPVEGYAHESFGQWDVRVTWPAARPTRPPWCGTGPVLVF